MDDAPVFRPQEENEELLAMNVDYNRPLVAVVTPIYNGARNLRGTMECVQAQTYENLIHVVIDNASTDVTPQIIQSFENARVPVHAFRNEKLLPLAENWETAVRKVPVTADYFIVLCHNDLLTPDAISKFVVVAEANPSVGVVGCQYTWGPRSDEQGPPQATDLPRDRNIFSGRWYLRSYLQQCHHALSPCHLLYRRSVLDERAPFYSQENTSIDIEACVATLANHDYGIVHEPLGFIRTDDGGLSDTLLADNGAYTKAWLNLINTYGPTVMSDEELDETRRAFLSHYYRRLLLWRFGRRDQSVFNQHREWLASKGFAPSIADYAQSLFVWARQMIKGKRHLVGRSETLCSKTWQELSEEVPAALPTTSDALALQSA